MPSLWIDALKQFNFERGAWCIPKKGSDDYMKVRALMADKSGKDAKVKAPADNADRTYKPAPMLGSDEWEKMALEHPYLKGKPEKAKKIVKEIAKAARGLKAKDLIKKANSKDKKPKVTQGDLDERAAEDWYSRAIADITKLIQKGLMMKKEGKSFDIFGLFDDYKKKEMESYKEENNKLQTFGDIPAKLKLLRKMKKELSGSKSKK